jgi:hypothetical protein
LIEINTNGQVLAKYNDYSGNEQVCTSAYTVGAWQHLAVTYSLTSGSGATATIVTTICVNGVQVGQTTISTGMNSSFGTSTYIAEYALGGSYYYQGSMARLETYSVALTQAQVQALVAGGTPPAGVVNEFLFMDAAGTTVTDSQGAGNITLVNAPTWNNTDVPLNTAKSSFVLGP